MAQPALPCMRRGEFIVELYLLGKDSYMYMTVAARILIFDVNKWLSTLVEHMLFIMS